MPSIVLAQQKIIVVQPNKLVQVVGASPGPAGADGPVGPQGPQGVPGPNVTPQQLQSVNATGLTDDDVLGWDIPTGMWIPVKMVRRAGDTMTGGLVIASGGLNVTGGIATNGPISSTGADMYVPDTGSYRNATSSKYLLFHGASNYWALANVTANGSGYIDADWLNIRNAAGGLRASIDAVRMTVHHGVLRVGDDAEFCDINVANTMQVRGVANTGIGALRYGSNATILGSGSQMNVCGDEIFFKMSNVSTDRMWLNANGLYLASSAFFRPVGNGGIFWESHGGGWYMYDANWMRVYNGKGIITSGVNVAISAENGCLIAGTAGPQSWSNRLYVQNNSPAGPSWSESHVIIRNATNPGQAQIAFHAHNVAPIIKGWYGDEAIEIRNNPDSGFVAIKASAFVVSSTLRMKKDVVEETDDAILSRVRPAKQIRFRQKIRPQYLRKEQRFKDLDAKWQERGRTPLEPKVGRDLNSADHDCEIDECDGTPDSPCSMTLNDTENIGLSAEAVYEYFPEAVYLDREGLPMGVDVSQIATAAFAAVGALARKVEALEQQLKKEKK